MLFNQTISQQLELTSINRLVDRRRDIALVRLGHALRLDPVAEQGSRVHSALESIAFPAELHMAFRQFTYSQATASCYHGRPCTRSRTYQVITVCSVAALVQIVVAPDEGLRAVRRPQGLVVVVSRVPHGLKGDLRHANGVRGRASTGSDESSFPCVVHVILVVGAIEVLAVPAGGEVMNRHNPSWARLFRELCRLGEPSHDVLQTSVAQTGVGSGLASRAANSHTEALKPLVSCGDCFEWQSLQA